MKACGVDFVTEIRDAFLHKTYAATQPILLETL
jgi:hypothetical protein